MLLWGHVAEVLSYDGCDNRVSPMFAAGKFSGMNNQKYVTV